MYKDALFIQCFHVCPVKRGSTSLGMRAIGSGSYVYIQLSLRNERTLIFRMIVSPPRPGGGFRDVQHVCTRQFSVLLARILGANVPPQFIAR